MGHLFCMAESGGHPQGGHEPPCEPLSKPDDRREDEQNKTVKKEGLEVLYPEYRMQDFRIF